MTLKLFASLKKLNPEFMKSLIDAVSGLRRLRRGLDKNHSVINSSSSSSLRGDMRSIVIIQSSAIITGANNCSNNNNDDDDDVRFKWNQLITDPVIIQACTLDTYFNTYYSLSDYPAVPLPYATTSNNNSNNVIPTLLPSHSSMITPRMSRYKRQVLESKSIIPLNESILEKYRNNHFIF